MVTFISYLSVIKLTVLSMYKHDFRHCMKE